MVHILKVNLFFYFVVANCNLLFAQEKKVLEEGYYVVVAAYSPSKEIFAQKYTSILKSKGKDAQYGYSTFKNLWFVYLHYNKNFNTSIDEMRALRQEEEFHDAWVYVMGAIYKTVVNNRKDSINPEIKEKITLSDADTLKEQKERFLTDPVHVQDNKQDSVEVEDVKVDSVLQESASQPKIDSNITLEDFKVQINLYNAANNIPVEGEIQLIDAHRLTLLMDVPANSTLNLPNPNSASGNLLLLADIFGFRKHQEFINFLDPLQDTIKSNIYIIDSLYIIDFNLVRYHKGDIVTMYNVFFYKDAAIMKPESKYEVNQLLNMMRENPKYRIRIHGHTNGRRPGKIITMGEDNNFYYLTEDDKEKFGSAKSLSKERAQIIKDYLIANGIDAGRMEIKAWGGRRMLYDTHSTKADQNVRVEVEILEE